MEGETDQGGHHEHANCEHVNQGSKDPEQSGPSVQSSPEDRSKAVWKIVQPGRCGNTMHAGLPMKRFESPPWKPHTVSTTS